MAEERLIDMTTEEGSGSLASEERLAGQEYLTFRLAEENYGVDIHRVQEIRGWEAVTRIPNTPEYVKGVLNLRGAIVPVIDTRQRLGMSTVEYRKETVVIVVKVIDAIRERVMGMVVDAVSDVFTAVPGNLRKTPKLGANIAVEYLTAVADVGEKMVMLLDVDKLMSRDVVREPEV
jgi:purine-binding chemotaxis protein CheW